MSDEELETRFKAIGQRFDRLVEFLAQEFEAVRREFDAVRGEIAHVDKRVGFLADLTGGIQSQLGALIR